MTHVHAPVIRPNSEIAAQARDIHPVQFTVRMLMTLLAAVFTALGWVVGRSWFVIVFLVLWSVNRIAWLGKCSQYGYAKGAKLNLVPRDE